MKMNLTAKRIAKLRNKPGRYRDKEVPGLILQVGRYQRRDQVQREHSPNNAERDDADEKAAVFGDELLGIIIGNERGENGPFPPVPVPGPGPFVPRVKVDDNSQDKVAKPDTGTTKKSISGGFNVTFDNIGIHEKRAKYDKDTRTIYINLDHPRIAVELKGEVGQLSVDDRHFLRMAYEIAFTEYAIVLAQELSGVQYYFDPQDALVDVRQTLDDLSKAYAVFWQQPQRVQ
jgi:hypothetical protein